MRVYAFTMGAGTQMIKDPETEARELQGVLNSVGERLRANIIKTGKLGVTYAEFKAKKGCKKDCVEGLKALSANGRA